MPEIREMGKIVVLPNYRGIGLFYELRIIEADEGRGIHRTMLKVLWEHDIEKFKGWLNRFWDKREQSREFPAEL